MKKKFYLITALLLALALSGGLYAYTWTTATATIGITEPTGDIATCEPAPEAAQPNWDSVLPVDGEVTEQLDQNNPYREDDKWHEVKDKKWPAQSFVAGLTGSLSKVALYLMKENNPGDLTIEIRDTVAPDYQPGNTILASLTISAATITTADEYEFTFSSPAAVVADTHYAIVLHEPEGVGGAGDKYGWGQYETSDIYPDGNVWLSGDSGGSWSVGGGGVHDFFFRTYVTVEVPPVIEGDVPTGDLFVVTPHPAYTGDLLVKVYLTNTGALIKAYQHLNMKLKLEGSVEAGETPNYRLLSLDNGVATFNLEGLVGVPGAETWTQTTQADFEAGVLNQVDTTTSPGDVMLENGISSNWYSANWQYRKKITIDHTKVDANLTDFPVLINQSSDTDLASNAQNDGDDILFTSSDGTTKLSHEIEEFDGGSGELAAWVRVPTLSSSTDTDIYMYYGNASATNQENVTGVWNSNFKMVQHLHEISKTSGTYNDHLDSTSNNNDGEAENGVTMNATGKIDGADEFDGVDDYVDCGNSTSLNIRNAVTLEVWIYMNERPSKDRWYNIVGKTEYYLYLAGTGETETLLGADFWIAGRRVDVWNEGVANINPSTWTHVVLTFDGTDIKGYVNGQHDFTKNKPGTIDDSSASDLLIGHYPGNDNRFNGIIDEVRISNTARSADWIATEYNNQSSPSTFYSVGGEEEGFVVYVSSGTIASPVHDTGESGTTWNQLSWSETLQANTDITFEVRASDTVFTKDAGSPAWTSLGTANSPITSGLPSGRYQQWRATLSTTNTANTPTLHDVTVTYTTVVAPTTYTLSVTGGAYGLVSEDPPEDCITPEFYCEVSQR